MVGLRALDRKALRDLRRMWSQLLAVALVMACGIMTLVLAIGAYRAMEDTKTAYYERYRFGHVFADLTRAPLALLPQVEAISGVSAAEPRIQTVAILDMTGMSEPVAGLVLSLPEQRAARVNRLFLREGVLPAAGSPDQIALDERFATAHSLDIGDGFSATMNGQRLDLVVSAIVLSPEFVYAPDPSGIAPDDKRFAVFFMSRSALASVMDMDGAFNSISLRTLHGSCTPCVIAALDDLLKPFGGRGAFDRERQTSHAFLTAELTGLQSMAQVVPPIFLLVSAFLVNMIFSRLISLEREQIGLLKANGYGAVAIAVHYGKLVVAVAFVGVFFGGTAGAVMGRALTRLYADFYKFPFLIYREQPDLYLIAGLICSAAALAGAAKAIWTAASLPPAVAMRPPAPPHFRRLLPIGRSMHQGLGSLVSQLVIMALRQLVHQPVRSLLTVLGTAFSVALMVTSLATQSAMEHMINTQFFRAERADARLDFTVAQNPSVASDVARLPGVMMTEPSRTLDVILHHRNLSERIGLTGKPVTPVLSRVLDEQGTPVDMPQLGIVLSERLATKLDLRVGQNLEIELLAENGRRVKTHVAGVIQTYLGLGAYMSLDYLDRLAQGGPRINSVWIKVDETRLDALYAAVKATPGLGSISLQSLSRDRFRELMAENISIMQTVYVVIAMIVAFGVAYNSARIQLSEKGRELASLRVLGFTRAEVFSVLLVELVVLIVLAQPVGWALGHGLAWLVTTGFASDLFRIPLVVPTSTYAWASIVVLMAACVSAFIIRRLVNRLDLIRVLKTRE